MGLREGMLYMKGTEKSKSGKGNRIGWEIGRDKERR